MDSRGGDRFSDYNDYSSDVGNEPSGKDGSAVDRCKLTEQIVVEEVESCEYFNRLKGVPPAKEAISLIVGARLSVISGNGMVIGYLPTQFNFLRACMETGHNYSGVVSSSEIEPIVQVTILLSDE